MDASASRFDASIYGTRTKSSPNLVRMALNSYGVWRQRRALSRLDDSALADIGLTRLEAEVEATRPFWDVPSSWRR